MNSDKLVSVIIPTYKRPDYLVRAVDSVLNQTYKNVEVVVADDNSDGDEGRLATEKVMARYSGDSRVIYCKHAVNKNGSAARNTGIKASHGAYIAFLDDDDEMLPERIELMVSRLEEMGAEYGACYSDFRKIMPGGISQTCGENREGDLHRAALMRSLYFCPGSNLLARAELVRKIGGFDEDFRRNQDVEFLARLTKITKLCYVDKLTLIIHYEDHSAGTRMSYQQLVDIDNFFLKKFEGDISELSKRDSRRIKSYFALERLRYAIPRHKTGDALANCIRSGVGPIIFIRYCFYVLRRMITKKSFGFRI